MGVLQQMPNVDVVCTCATAPVQYSGRVGVGYLYFRSRYNHWTCCIADTKENAVAADQEGDAGVVVFFTGVEGDPNGGPSIRSLMAPDASDEEVAKVEAIMAPWGLTLGDFAASYLDLDVAERIIVDAIAAYYEQRPDEAAPRG